LQTLWRISTNSALIGLNDIHTYVYYIDIYVHIYTHHLTACLLHFISCLTAATKVSINRILEYKTKLKMKLNSIQFLG